MQPTGTTLVSGEGVRLELGTAGVGSRLLAAAIDVLVQGTALLVIVLLTGLVAAGSDGAAVAAVVITESVLVLAGYPIVMEWLGHGRTLGKIAFGLRVVRDDGGPIGFRHALVRGLAGLVLEKPGLLAPISTAAGVIALALSGQDKRIGDMMAGTVVLNERAAPMPQADPPFWVPVPLQPWALSLDLRRLDDRLALALRQFVGRAHAMSPAAQDELGIRLRGLVEAAVAPPPPAYAPTPDVLMSVLAERRRRALAGERGPWSPASGPASAPAATTRPHDGGESSPFAAPR